MQHLDEGTIHSWLDGALSADEAARAEAHVAECPQCAAAVAEARGFIAASSRILTSLDYVPRGVVPAAPPVRWSNRAVWRVAAAVLIVATGSLIVVRNTEHKAGVAPAAFDSVRFSTTAAAQPQILAPSLKTTEKRNVQSSSPVTQSAPSAIPSGAALFGKPTAEADFSGKRVGSAGQPNVLAHERARTEAAAGAVDGYAAARSQVGGAVIAAPQSESVLSSRVPGVTTMDAASEQSPLKVIGAPKRLGAKVTLYEVTPGDTVTLTELLNVQLEGIVTGVSSAQPLMGRAARKSVAAPTQRADATVVTAPDSQIRTEAAGAVPPAAAASPLQVEVVNGVTTISWPDLTTGNVLKLSGRMPVERLKEVKRRIERERAAAATKKSP
jgi:Putative zinc-finger